MKLVVGLGNPGNDYRGTRHNAGFEVVDALVKRHARDAGRERFGAICWEAELRVDGVQDKVLFMKPLTFMNLSGDPVAQAMRFHKLDAAHDLLVVADDLALPVGHIRLRQDGGRFPRLCEQLPRGALALLIGGSPCQDLTSIGPGGGQVGLCGERSVIFPVLAWALSRARPDLLRTRVGRECGLDASRALAGHGSSAWH